LLQKLDDCIDKGRVTYIGGAVPLGLAPREDGSTNKGDAPLCLTLIGMRYLYTDR
jgi:hypothetical protein